MLLRRSRSWQPVGPRVQLLCQRCIDTDVESLLGRTLVRFLLAVMILRHQARDDPLWIANSGQKLQTQESCWVADYPR